MGRRPLPSSPESPGSHDPASPRHVSNPLARRRRTRRPRPGSRGKHPLESLARAALRGRSCPGRGPSREHGSLRRGHRPAHGSLAQRPLHRRGALHGRPDRLGLHQPPHERGALPGPQGRHHRVPEPARSLRARRPLRSGPGASDLGSRGEPERLAHALRPQHVPAPVRRRAGRNPSRLRRAARAPAPGQPGAPRHSRRHRRGRESGRADRAGGRHALRGRDQEIHLLVDELLPARQGRAAHALLGEHRRGW